MSLHDALKAIDDLTAAVQQLAANVLPGTARPSLGHLSNDRKREQAALHRLEQQEREERSAKARGPFAIPDPIGKGETQDPYRMDIADLLTNILVAVDTLADRVSQSAGVNPQPPATSAYENPTRFLVHIRAWLDMAVESDVGLSDRIRFDFDVLVLEANVLLGHFGDGHRLPYDCPWCATDRLRIRSLRVSYTDHEVYRPHIVCESGLCSVDEEQVGHWHKGRPAWDLINEGEWFGRCVEAVMKGRLCRCNQPLPLTGLGGRPADYCGPECRLAARRERDAAKRDERLAS